MDNTKLHMGWHIDTDGRELVKLSNTTADDKILLETYLTEEEATLLANNLLAMIAAGEQHGN